MSKQSSNSAQIKGIKFVKKGALLFTNHDQKFVRNLSHVVVFNYPDYHTGSSYEILYFHLN